MKSFSYSKTAPPHSSLNSSRRQTNNAQRRFTGVDPKGPFSKNINMIQNNINFYKKKNSDLKETINLLNGAMETMDERRKLFKQLDHDIVDIYNRLDERSINLSNIESTVRSFRQTPLPAPRSAPADRSGHLTQSKRLPSPSRS